MASLSRHTESFCLIQELKWWEKNEQEEEIKYFFLLPCVASFPTKCGEMYLGIGKCWIGTELWVGTIYFPNLRTGSENNEIIVRTPLGKFPISRRCTNWYNWGLGHKSCLQSSKLSFSLTASHFQKLVFLNWIPICPEWIVLSLRIVYAESGSMWTQNCLIAWKDSVIVDAYFVIIEWKGEAVSKIILFRITQMQTQTIKHLAFCTRHWCFFS